MSQQNIPVKKYMTPSPSTIGKKQTLEVADRLMNQNAIRHLPVLDGGKVIGLLSDRDIYLIKSLKELNPSRMLVEDAMSPDPFVVEPETPLKEVVQEMSAQKYGSAIVMQDDQMMGIFTTVDALKVIADLL